LFVLAAVVVLSVAEVTSERFDEFTRDHALLSTCRRSWTRLEPRPTRSPRPPIGSTPAGPLSLSGKRSARSWITPTSFGDGRPLERHR